MRASIDLEAVGLEVALDFAVCPRVEVQEVLSDDEHGRAGARAVVGHVLHQLYGLLEPPFRAVHAAFAHTVRNRLQACVECPLRAALLELVGPGLAQQLLHDVDHGQAHRNADGGCDAHFEARVHVVEVDVVVRDNRHVGKSRVVECLARERRVVGEPAVAYVLALSHWRRAHRRTCPI